MNDSKPLTARQAFKGDVPESTLLIQVISYYENIFNSLLSSLLFLFFHCC